jgi:hypothetical protein
MFFFVPDVFKFVMLSITISDISFFDTVLLSVMSIPPAAGFISFEPVPSIAPYQGKNCPMRGQFAGRYPFFSNFS